MEKFSLLSAYEKHRVWNESLKLFAYEPVTHCERRHELQKLEEKIFSCFARVPIFGSANLAGRENRTGFGRAKRRENLADLLNWFLADSAHSHILQGTHEKMQQQRKFGRNFRPSARSNHHHHQRQQQRAPAKMSSSCKPTSAWHFGRESRLYVNQSLKRWALRVRNTYSIEDK